MSADSAARLAEYQHLWETEVLPVIIEENKRRAPWPCQCGRGLVRTIHGCLACTSEGARAFEASLLADKPRGQGSRSDVTNGPKQE